MSEHKKKHKKASYQTWLVPGIIGLAFLVGIGFLVKVVSTDTGPRKKEQISTVTLLKPPPEVKEKPPEPEVVKEIPKDTMTAPMESPQPQNQAQDQQQDAPPAGADLGVEGDGAAGSDGFGLVAKGKGKGRDITLGGGGGGGGMNKLALMSKYGWYTSKIQDEIKKQMRALLDKTGGMPKGKFQATVRIQLDAKGSVVKYQLVASSGNDKMDEALKGSLPGLRMSQPPPDGMPAGMTLRIVSQG
jgi:outer membrane biosynthesis protein TonB